MGSSADSPPSAVITPAGKPFAPTGVTAVAGHRQATINWQAAGGNGAPVISYTIVPSTPCPGCQGLTVSGGSTSTTVTGLHPGDTFSFSAVATNSVGDSGPSAPSGLITLPSEIPSVPTNVRATAGINRASVTWDQSDPNGSTISLYTVTASPGGATATSPGGGATPIENLTNGTAYTFTVVATNGVGNSPPSGPSNAVTPADLPGPPSNVRVTYGNGEATVGWDPADGRGGPILSYTVTATPAAGVGTITVGGDARSGLVSGLDNNTLYSFGVVATTATGDSPSADTPFNSLRAIADGYMSSSLDDFLATKQQKPGPFNWSDDGCSIIKYAVPQDEAWFHDACTRHDFGYRNYGNGLRLQRDDGTKQQIDSRLLDDMHYICNNRLPLVDYPPCMVRAQYIYEGVNDGGGFAFYG